MSSDKFLVQDEFGPLNFQHGNCGRPASTNGWPDLQLPHKSLEVGSLRRSRPARPLVFASSATVRAHCYVLPRRKKYGAEQRDELEQAFATSRYGTSFKRAQAGLQHTCEAKGSDCEGTSAPLALSQHTYNKTLSFDHQPSLA